MKLGLRKLDNLSCLHNVGKLDLHSDLPSSEVNGYLYSPEGTGASGGRDHFAMVRQVVSGKAEW